MTVFLTIFAAVLAFLVFGLLIGGGAELLDHWTDKRWDKQRRKDEERRSAKASKEAQKPRKSAEDRALEWEMVAENAESKAMRELSIGYPASCEMSMASARLARLNADLVRINSEPLSSYPEDLKGALDDDTYELLSIHRGGAL